MSMCPRHLKKINLANRLMSSQESAKIRNDIRPNVEAILQQVPTQSKELKEILADMLSTAMVSGMMTERAHAICELEHLIENLSKDTIVKAAFQSLVDAQLQLADNDHWQDPTWDPDAFLLDYIKRSLYGDAC